ALAAARDQKLLALAREIAELLVRVGIPHHRAERHRHVEIRAAAARAVVGPARLAVGGTEGPLDAEIRQCVDPRCGAQADAASVAAVAAVRPAEGHELLAADTRAAATAVAGLHLESRLDDALHPATLAHPAGAG